MQLGLIASREYLDSEDSPLHRLLHRCGDDIRRLGLTLRVPADEYDAVGRISGFTDHPALMPYPGGRFHDIIRMTAAILDTDGSGSLDGIIHLAVPGDESILAPELRALKRVCLVHSKPYLITAASAADLIEAERILCGLPPRPRDGSQHPFAHQAIALIAHDAWKPCMVEFVVKHFALLSGFSRRICTGTTGRRLNDLARQHGWSGNEAWATCYESGPMGGDVQIADLVLSGQCQRVIFFHDVRVSHPHKADMLLLERAIAASTAEVVYFSGAAAAYRWAEAAEREV
ncbi:methylglyoxal synthase [Luteibacter sp. E-22]|uniref:methylglyoxal synthase n=1 Tax=Luteibacter sp. E-22 TaxID=3404050 RepID=UPI003CFB5A2A